MTNKKIPWQIVIPSEVITEYAGTKLGEYYSNPDIRVASCISATEKLKKLYGLDIGIGFPGHAYAGVSAFGSEILFPEDDAPMVKEPVFKTMESLKNAKLPDMGKSGLMPQIIKDYEYAKAKYPKGKIGLSSGGEGPMTTAVLLRGQGFFVDLYDHPEICHRFLDICAQSYIESIRFIDNYSGKITSRQRIGIADDFGGMMSASMFKKFVLPYWKKIYEAFPDASRSLHCETLTREHLKFLDILKITGFDPGTDRYLTVSDIVGSTKARFTWNLFTVKDMLQGTPASIEEIYKKSVEDGSPAMMTELCRGIPQKNIHAFIKIAKKYE